MIGQRLSGRYEIRREVGEGGMGIVYQAVDTLLGRYVAVKMLRSEFSGDEAFVERFRREARAAARLSHPNIVQVFDVGRDDTVDYIVMEYVEGRTLKEKIKQEGALSVPVAVRLVQQVLEALRHAHRQGVIHRDIKPQNILLTTAGQIKVTDFGIARAVGTATLAATDHVMGSAHYISPEQARGGYTGERSDLYSLGIVLFELLTGLRPFDGETPVSVAVKHLQEKLPELRSLNPAVPDTLERIVRKAVNKEPEDRYASADEFLEDLWRYRTASPRDIGPPAHEGGSTRVLPRLEPNGEAPPAESRAGLETAASVSPWWGRLGRLKNRKIMALILSVLVLVAGVGYGAYAFMGWLNPPQVQLRDLTGADLEAARDSLAAYQIQIRVVSERHDPARPAGTILWQTPEAGETVPLGGVVEVGISLGPEWVEGGVPDLRGEALRDAEMELGEVGLTADIAYRYHALIPEGEVIEQSPEPGAQVTAGTVVRLVVGSGPEPAPVEVPHFIGRPLAEARDRIRELGMELGALEARRSDYPRDFVQAQDPPPGAILQPGQRIHLTVSQGNGEEPNRDDITVTLPDSPRVQKVEVRVQDRSERIVYVGEHTGGSSFDTTVHWYEPRAVLTVYVNGEVSNRIRLPDDRPSSEAPDSSDSLDSPGPAGEDEREADAGG